MHNDSAVLCAIEPYYWVFSLFVLTPPPPLLLMFQDCRRRGRNLPTKRRWWKFFFVLYSLLMLALTFRVTFVNNIVIDIVVHDFELDSISSVLSVCVSMSVSVVQALMQFSAVWEYQKLCQIFRRVAQLEQDISAQVSLLSQSQAIATPYRTSFRCRLARRSGALLIFLITLLPFVHYHLVADFMPVPDKLLTVLFGLLIQIKSIEYCVVVQLVETLLLQLQQRHLLPLQRAIVMDPPALRHAHLLALQANQNLLARIWDLVNTIERYFALPMFVLFLYNGLEVTHTINWAYIRYQETNATYNIFNVSFTTIIVINMMVPCCLSQSCIEVYNKFGAVLHNLKSSCVDLNLNMRLREYSMQMMHQKVIFTCGGFFDINLKYFGAMILTITTYVVILIQFKLQAEAEIEQQQQLLNNMQHQHQQKLPKHVV